MIKRLSSAFAQIGAVGLVLSACAVSPAADIILSLPQDVQVAAYMECQGQYGFNAPEALNVLPLNDGRVSVSLPGGKQISRNQARVISLCARTTLLAENTGVNAQRTQTPGFGPTPTSQSSAQYRPFACTKGGHTFQRGTLICPRY